MFSVKTDNNLLCTMDMNPRTNRFDRKAAFSMNVDNPSSDEPDPIFSGAELCGSFISFHENSISEIKPAEVIDPDNKELDTKHSYQFLYQIGSKNHFVARSILQAKSILDSVILRQGLSKQAILDHIWDCTKHLINCENSYRTIYNDTVEKMHQCDEIIRQAKGSSHIPSLPQVDDLEQRVVTFLGNAKRFLEKAHELLCVFYNTPHLDSNFEAYRKWMTKNEPTRNDVIQLLEQDKDWIKLLAWYRNALDINHAKQGFSVSISNFKMHAGNKFSNPCWQFDFQGKGGDAQESPSDLIKDMSAFLGNLLPFFEALYLTCIKDNWDDKWDFIICQHEDEAVREKCPIQFFISLRRIIDEHNNDT